MSIRRKTNRPRASAVWMVAALAALFAIPMGASAQADGAIRGVVLEAGTQSPVSGVQVFIRAGGEVSHGTLTDQQGRYLLRGVPAGSHTLMVEMLGYGADSREVTVAAGETVTVNFRLETTALELDEIVVTGVAGATLKAKVPFDVSKISTADLPVPAVNAGGAIQGKVAGARVINATGQPGQGQSIMLRGATSLNAGGRGQGPMLIVDGVILGSGTLSDIDALDIESIEVVKGAAAASLYGSRAANGVIQIQTKRGTALREDVTNYTVRTEMGSSQLANKIQLAQSHRLRMNQAGTSFLNADGDEVGFGDAALIEGNTSRAFLDQPFPGQTYDQIDRFFNPGSFMQNYVSMEGRTGNTNYYGSFSNYSESGIVRFNDGYERRNFRLNLDHGLREDLQLSLSTFYSDSWQDLLDTGSGSNVFFNLTFVPPNIDLLEEDPETNELKVNPNPRSLEDNPLYPVRYRDLERERQRFMSSGLVRYAPVSWFDVEGNVSFDRSSREQNLIYPKGYARGAVDPSALTAGDISQNLNVTQALNTSATASFFYNVGELNTRTRARYLYESERREGFNARGRDLVVEGVPSLDAATGDRFVGSYVQDIRSEGYFLITALDYADKYILDALIRRDGSSLFGADERWHTYGRVSGAWRLGLEPWFQLPAVNEFKLRGSYGTAGGRPRFEAQYETYTISGSGAISPSTLGNRNLKPELSREIELGIDAELFDRFSMGLTYADTRTEDQILPVPLPGLAGFNSQWRNAGTLESKTWEATLESNILQRGDFNWSARLLFDRTRTEITELDVPAFQAGSSSAYFIREGEELGTLYGHRWATSCADLPADAQQFCGQFTTDNNGYFVWTGDNSLRDGPGPDGIAGTGDDVWGTNCPDAVAGSVEGAGCEFGVPVYAVCEDENGEPTIFCAMGNTIPDYNLAFANTFTWKGLSLYGLLDASQGFDVYNQTIQWAYREEMAGAVDQRGVAEDQKKPIKYFVTLYDVNAVNSHYVEDGSYVKLREASLRYSFGNDILSSLPGLRNTNRLTLSLIGRNLFTWTNYTGYDPEVGNPNSIFQSASVDRFDGYQYPNFRTLTGSVEISF